MTPVTALVTGGSRGIGQAIAARFAKGYRANIVVVSKDTKENVVATEQIIAAAGGRSLIIDGDVADSQLIEHGVTCAVKEFGGIDILVNNTSGTFFGDARHTTAEQFDWVMATSVRATMLFARACYAHLARSPKPHIINISPPLNLEPQWFKDHLAFSVAKYGMSMCTLGLAEEFRDAGIAVNSLWPQTIIATQTIKDHLVASVFNQGRFPSIMGDAAFYLSQGASNDASGCFFTDEEILRNHGVTDFDHYAVDPSQKLMQPLFIPLEEHRARISPALFLKP